MDSQFQGVQIFMDFVVACYPRKLKNDNDTAQGKKFLKAKHVFIKSRHG